MTVIAGSGHEPLLFAAYTPCLSEPEGAVVALVRSAAAWSVASQMPAHTIVTPTAIITMPVIRGRLKGRRIFITA